MSAYVVSHNHIHALVGFAIHHEVGVLKLLPRERYDELCTMLLEENMKSVNHRYREHDEVMPMRFDNRYQYAPAVLNMAAAIKAIQGYQYQACEHPGWETSTAKEFTDRLKSFATYHLLESLPEYQDAAWGIR